MGKISVSIPCRSRAQLVCTGPIPLIIRCSDSMALFFVNLSVLSTKVSVSLMKLSLPGKYFTSLLLLELHSKDFVGLSTSRNSPEIFDSFQYSLKVRAYARVFLSYFVKDVL